MAGKREAGPAATVAAVMALRHGLRAAACDLTWAALWCKSATPAREDGQPGWGLRFPPGQGNPESRLHNAHNALRLARSEAERHQAAGQADEDSPVAIGTQRPDSALRRCHSGLRAEQWWAMQGESSIVARTVTRACCPQEHCLAKPLTKRPFVGRGLLGEAGGGRSEDVGAGLFSITLEVGGSHLSHIGSQVPDICGWRRGGALGHQ